MYQYPRVAFGGFEGGPGMMRWARGPKVEVWENV